MAKFVHADVLEGGLNVLKNNITKMYLISTYAVNDSYATVVGNKLAEVNMTSTDFTISASGNNRVVTVTAGKSTTATSATGSTTGLFVAFTDGTSKVLWVTEATTNIQASQGATVNFPAVTYTSNQPV